MPARYHSAAVIILGIALSALDGTIFNLALPGIARDLHASAADSVWVVNAYQLAALAMLLPLAALGDRFGYRRIYLCGIAVFTAASAVCFVSTSLQMLAAARGVQGLGAAGIMAVNGALVRLTYPRHLFGRGIALNSAVVATASVAGPSVAAVVLSVATWPWLFTLNLPLGGIVVWLGWRALPHNTPSSTKGTRISLLDVALNAMMFSLLFVGVHVLGTATDGPPEPGRLAPSIGLVLVAVLVGLIYLRRQLSLVVPLFPIDLLRIPLFALSMCTSVASFAAQTLSYIALPFLLLEGWKYSQLETGLLITVWPLAIVAVAPLAGRMIGRYPGGLLGGMGLAALAAGLALLAALPEHPSSGNIAWRMALCGAGFGLFQSPNNHTILTSAPAHRSGAAGGMLATARLTGQNIGAVLLAVIFSLWNAHNGQGPMIALWLAAGFAAIASLFSILRVRHAPTRV